MGKLAFKLSFVVLFFCLIVPFHFSKAFTDVASNTFEWKRFRLGQYSFFQMSSGFNTVFSAELSWNPEYALDSNWGLVGHLGVVPMFSQPTHAYFLNLRSGLFLSYRLGQFVGELGPGLVTWMMSPHILSLNTSANVLYNFKNPVFLMDAVFIGYSAVFQTPAAHEARVGVQIKF